jgi:hypothetical protein
VRFSQPETKAAVEPAEQLALSRQICARPTSSNRVMSFSAIRFAVGRCECWKAQSSCWAVYSSGP